MFDDFPHYNKVDGWLRIEALRILNIYKQNFLAHDDFDAMEIGVHHGRFFIGIENLTPSSQRCIAIDLFEDQDKNIDNSGKGNLEKFNQNIAEYGVNPDRVQALSMDSLDIIPRNLGEQKFGIISIDGGHTARHTISDLKNASQLMSAEGIVILDDISNQNWLGVISGACEYFISNASGRLVPFAIGFNKLFCCHFSHSNKVIDFLMNEREKLATIGVAPFKMTELSGHRVVSLRPTSL